MALRYVMLETLRADAAGLLAGGGEQGEARPHWPGTRCGWPSRPPAGGLRPVSGRRPSPGGWMPRTPRRRAGTGLGHGTMRGRRRLANALGWWWVSYAVGCVGQYDLLQRSPAVTRWAATGGGTARSGCGLMALGRPIWPERRPFHRGRGRRRGPSAIPGADRRPGRPANGIGDGPGCRGGRRSPPLAGPGREIGDPVGELLALVALSFNADYAGDHHEGRYGWPGRPGRSRPDPRPTRPDAVQLGADERADRCRGLAEAELVGAAGLARARDAGDLWNQLLLLPRIVELDLRAGRAATPRRTAGRAPPRGADRRARASWRFGLSQCGELCAATGRAAEALTLWAACAAADQHQGPTGPPWFVPRREEQQRQARQALGSGRARAAEDRGAAMSLATAAEYALMLTDPGPPRSAPGPVCSAPRERELVTLVAQGRTNAQIAAELHISVRTVRLAPGPGPGQDRLPPPRRPDSSGPQRTPGLARPAQPRCLWVV